MTKKVERQDLESLWIKSFSGKASSGEEQLIQQWLDESEENRKEFAAYKKLWDDSGKLMFSTRINTEKALFHTKKRIPEFSRNIRWIPFLRQAAAVLILAIVLSVVLDQMKNRRPEIVNQLVYQEIKAAYGTQTKLTLADGTAVWLNSGSSLRFPLSFENSATRQVELKGEGYFEVTKDTERPFIVDACSLQVKVLGTSFNVNAYENEKQVEVALISGKVELQKKVNGAAVPVMTLDPSEVAAYDAAHNRVLHKKEKEIGRYAAWKEGKIVFFDDPVEKVVARLENWYNVDIEIADSSLMAYHFTATFSQESLDQVLKYLSISTPLKYKFVPLPKTADHGQKQTKIIVFGKS